MAETRTSQQDGASTAQLLVQLSDQVRSLLRDELRLARLELADKGKRSTRGIVAFAAAAVIALYGGGTLVAAAVIGLDEVLYTWLAALVIGLVLLVVAGVLALLGKRYAQQAVPPTPEETVDEMKKDVSTVKERARR